VKVGRTDHIARPTGNVEQIDLDAPKRFIPFGATLLRGDFATSVASSGRTQVNSPLYTEWNDRPIVELMEFGKKELVFEL